MLEFLSNKGQVFHHFQSIPTGFQRFDPEKVKRLDSHKQTETKKYLRFIFVWESGLLPVLPMMAPPSIEDKHSSSF